MWTNDIVALVFRRRDGGRARASALAVLVSHGGDGERGESEPKDPENEDEGQVAGHGPANVVVVGDAQEGDAVVGEKRRGLAAAKVIEHLGAPTVAHEEGRRPPRPRARDLVGVEEETGEEDLENVVDGEDGVGGVDVSRDGGADVGDGGAALLHAEVGEPIDEKVTLELDGVVYDGGGE